MGLAPGQAGGYEQDGEGGIIPLEAEVQDSGLARETPHVTGGHRARVLVSPRTFEGRGQRTTAKVLEPFRPSASPWPWQPSSS